LKTSALVKRFAAYLAFTATIGNALMSGCVATGRAQFASMTSQPQSKNAWVALMEGLDAAGVAANAGNLGSRLTFDGLCMYLIASYLIISSLLHLCLPSGRQKWLSF
jgi:hypothetical protein